VHNTAPKYRHYMRAWREYRGMTQEQVARELGTDRGMISRYENNECGLTLAVQFKLFGALDITPAQFFQPPGQTSLDALAQKASPERRKAILAVLQTMLDLD
jgi:transcriptional regulator with XRE-family HTH domain